MPLIVLTTFIAAPIQICFDLSRSVELHQISTSRTREKAVAGRTSGLCNKGDTITWRAKHLGIYQKLTVEITKLNFPIFFEDQMKKGVFKRFTHQHSFEEANGITIMKDVFDYEVPFGSVGKIFNKLFLKKYMTNLLVERNKTIKLYAELGRWEKYLSN